MEVQKFFTHQQTTSMRLTVLLVADMFGGGYVRGESVRGDEYMLLWLIGKQHSDRTSRALTTLYVRCWKKNFRILYIVAYIRTMNLNSSWRVRFNNEEKNVLAWLVSVWPV